MECSTDIAQDLAFYGLGLNNTIVLHAIGYADGANLYDKLYKQAAGMMILAVAGSLPGYWTAIFLIDTVGRKYLQIIGFVLLTVLFCILGFKLQDLSEQTMLILYIFGQFLFNAGPNTTTFIVAAECFPTRYRSTAHGISAAMGKLGAVFAQVISIPMLQSGSPEGCSGNACSPKLNRLLQLFALFMFLGTLVSILIPETKGLTLEELSGETRTSYNDGINDTPIAPKTRMQALNPFTGGRPAGFAYPRAQAAMDKAGIMNSNIETTRQRRPFPWRRRWRPRSAAESYDIALSNTSSRSEPPAPVQQQALPTWGAGWGRIDRGVRPRSADKVELQDEGGLLE